jgi:CBS domain-containing protein
MITIVREMLAKDLMTEEVLTIDADWPLDKVAEFLIENGISGAPVVSENGLLIGVVSMTDLVRHETLPERNSDSGPTPQFYRAELEHEYDVDELGDFRIANADETTARDIMTPIVFRVSETASLKHVAETMIRGQIHRLFVTREGKVVGVISTLDLLKVIRDL